MSTTLRAFARARLAHLALVLALTAGAWGAAFGNGFVYDDRNVILHGERIHDPANLPGLFVHPTMWTSSLGAEGNFVKHAQLDTWRPVTMSTFVLDAALAGREPWAYHLTNLLLHLAATAALLALAWRLLPPGHDPIAAASAAFFGLHPLLAEAHVWINGRSDVLATLLLLLALNAFLRATDPAHPLRRTLPWSLASALALLAAALSKEVVLPALLTFPLFAHLTHNTPLTRPRLQSLAIALTPHAAATALYLAGRHLALAGIKATGSADQLSAALTRAPHLLFHGILDAIVPTNTSFRYLFEEYRDLDATGLLIGAIGLTALATLAIAQRRRVPLLPPALLAFALTLAPAALITTTVGWCGFNRYLYLPVAFLAIALASAATTLTDALAAAGRTFALRALAIGAAAVLLAFAALDLATVGDYRDDEALWTAAIAADPDASHGYLNLGSIYFEQGRIAEATPLLARAVELGPENPRAFNTLAIVLIEQRRFDEARAVALAGWQRWPANSDLCNLTAITLIDADPPRAAEAMLECLRIDPAHASTRNNIQGVLAAHPQRDTFRAAFLDLLTRDRYQALRPGLLPLLQPNPTRP